MWSSIFVAVVLISSGVLAEDCVPLRCTLPLKVGTCGNSTLQYYFDVTSGQCKQFTYTGCGGNVNRFKNRRLCERSCVRTCEPETTPDTASTAPKALPAHCSLPKETGPCRALHPRYYFHAPSGMCQRFSYGGCRGNANNFVTLKSCEDSCVNY